MTRLIPFSFATPTRSYLEAILFAVQSGLGSRGSAMVIDSNGVQAHGKLGDEWKFAPENKGFRDKVLKTLATEEKGVASQWVDRRPIPEPDSWFETTWAAFRKGDIYSDG